MRQSLLAWAITLPLALAACGHPGGEGGLSRDLADGGSPDASQPGTDGGVALNCFGPQNILCHGLTPSQYQPGMVRPTQDGKYNVALWFDGTGPRLGTQTITAEFMDAVSGQPVPGLKTRVIADLHDVGPAPDPVATEKGKGFYEFTPVTLDQVGYWEVVILSLVPSNNGTGGGTVSLIDLFFWAQ